MTGLAAATSGVAHPQPKNPPPPEGSLCAYPFCPPNGLAKLGWLKILKNSARNWAPKCSPNLKFLATDRSTFLNPVSRKMLRPMVPNVPNANSESVDPWAAAGFAQSGLSMAKVGSPGLIGVPG